MEASATAPFLALDSGALFFKGGSMPPVIEKQAEVTAAGIVEAYNRMGYTAVGVAAQDLAAGLPFLLNLQKQADFALVSSNLVRRSNGRHVFAGQIIQDIGAIKVGIIGITDPAAASLLNPQDDAMILSWESVLPELVAELGSRCDMVILLSNLPFSANKMIAEKLDGIHLILQTGTNMANMQPQQIANTIITQTEKQGKYLGTLSVVWQQTKRWGEDKQKLLTAKKTALDRLHWQISRYRKKGDPEQIFRDQPARLAAYKNLQNRYKTALQEIRSLEEAIAREKLHGPSASTYKSYFYAMEASTPDDPAVSAMVEKIIDKVNAIGREAAQQRKKTKSDEPVLLSGSAVPYIGWLKCAQCHGPQAERFKKTRHARAYQTLVKNRQQFNADCIACHVTGIISGADPNAFALPESLQLVGCEVCHGPGGKHATDPSVWPLARIPAESVCLRCHVQEHDDNFHYQEDLQKLACSPAH